MAFYSNLNTQCSSWNSLCALGHRHAGTGSYLLALRETNTTAYKDGLYNGVLPGLWKESGEQGHMGVMAGGSACCWPCSVGLPDDALKWMQAIRNADRLNGTGSRRFLLSRGNPGADVFIQQVCKTFSNAAGLRTKSHEDEEPWEQIGAEALITLTGDAWLKMEQDPNCIFPPFFTLYVKGCLRG